MKTAKVSVYLTLVVWVVCALEAVTIIEKRERDTLILQCPEKATEWWRRSRGIDAELMLTTAQDGHTFVCAGTFSYGTICRKNMKPNFDQYADSVTFSSINLEDAGLYICNPNNTNCQMDVLVVKGADPTLTVAFDTSSSTSAQVYEVMPGTSFTLQCSLTFSGFTSPDFQLVMRSRTGSEIILESASLITGSEYKANKILTLSHRYAPNENDRNFGVSCKWNDVATDTKQFQTIYGPEFFSSADETIVLRDSVVILNCSADSYPAATYSWYQSNNYGRIGSIGFISSETYKTDKTGQYECDAYNSKKNVKITKRFTIKASTSFFSGSDLYLAGILVPIVLILVPMWLIMRCARQYRASMHLARIRTMQLQSEEHRHEPEPEPEPSRPTPQTPPVNPSNEIWVMGAPPPLYDAPPTYDEAIKSSSPAAPAANSYPRPT